MFEDGTEDPGVAEGLGALSAAMGETDKAVSWLELAYQAGFRDPVILGLDPMFDSVRGDERFIQLIARIEADLADMRSRAFSPIAGSIEASQSGGCR